MHIVTTKKLKVGLMLAVLLTMTACGGGSSDTIIDATPKDRYANISFINGLDNTAAFHIKTRLLNRDVFDDKQKAADVPRYGRSDYLFKWISGSGEQSQIGVINIYDRTRSMNLHLDFEHQASYWTIAWLNGEDYRLAMFKKSSTDEVGKFSVRVFSNTEQDVRVNGDNTVVASTVKGQLIGPFSVDDCATGLTVGEHVIDLCNEAAFGKSYLAVVDSGGKLIVVPEQ